MDRPCGLMVDALQERHRNFDHAKAFLTRLRDLHMAMKSEERKSRGERFKRLEEVLDTTSLRLVVLGEFSRGKSYLLNALLGIRLLPTAREATTAINTFIQKLESGRSERFIRIVWRAADRPPLELPWKTEDEAPANGNGHGHDTAPNHDRDDVLRRWGSELDLANGDARQEVERIEVFMDHELLRHDLVIIDTPGMESVKAHHLDITMAAVDQAHIAIWVQSTDQLGGNQREWEFLNKTLRKNFRKFITVINMWDKVLEPSDVQDQAKPEAERAREKLEYVRRQFRNHVEDRLSTKDLERLCDGDHLFGVSAVWALADDPRRREQSNIMTLARRITEMAASREAVEEILLKPLRAMLLICNEMKQDLQSEQAMLASSRDIENLRMDRDRLETEIKGMELEQQRSIQDSRLEHRNNAVQMAREIQERLLQPLRHLKDGLTIHLTQAYVRRQIERGVRKIGLPSEIAQEYDQTFRAVHANWQGLKKELERRLQDLREAFGDKMRQVGESVARALQDAPVTMPELDIKITVDLSEIESFHEARLKLEQDRAQSEQMLEEIMRQREHCSVDERLLRDAQLRLERLEERLDALGGQPAPNKIAKTGRTEGGLYSSGESYTYYDYDASNVEDWKAQRERLDEKITNQEEEILRIQNEMQQKMKQSVSIEAARRKYEQEVERIRKAAERAEANYREQLQESVQKIHGSLQRQTIQHIERLIGELENHVSQAVEKAFMDQLDMLAEGVREQYVEPLKTQSHQLEETVRRLNEGEQQVARRQGELGGWMSQLEELRQNIEYVQRHLNGAEGDAQ